MKSAVGTKKSIRGSFSVKSGRIPLCIEQRIIASTIHEIGTPLITTGIYVRLKQAMLSSVACIESRFKQWTRPAKRNQIMSTVADLKRSKGALIAENMLLRQQLIVLERQVVRPRLTQHDRRVLVLLASRIEGWREALVVVKPDTLLRWHREGFRLYWKRKSCGKRGRPPTSPDVIALIEEMAVKNRAWRAPRIKGELLKLGIVVHAETVKKYMRRARKGLPPRNQGQAWATFIKNHAGETWACDFVQTYDLLFRVVFVYFIIEMGSRRVVKYPFFEDKCLRKLGQHKRLAAS